MARSTLTASRTQNPATRLWLRLGALILVVAALGLPINDLMRYALLLGSCVVIFTGTIERQPARWALAALAAALSIAVHWLTPAPRIEEGHNVFIVDGSGGALERGLPAAVYRAMLNEFDATYPPDKRCDPKAFGCWRGSGFPDRVYAFSADAVFDRPAMSRRVTSIDVDDPVWARLGFVNELQYNWTGSTDIQREARKEHWWQFVHPWRLTMPYFVAYRFPVAFAGSQICWRGHVLWEGDNGVFTSWQHDEPACRAIEERDIGRTIFGAAIAKPLSIELNTGAWLQTLRLIEPVAAVLAAMVNLMLLARVARRQLTLPFTLIALSLIVVFFNDATFIGTVRPFDGGDDGLFYEGLSRRLLQFALAGDWRHFLEGGEPVYFYGGPGLRYLRALEHVVFGDTFLGYLSLTLLLPFLVLTILRRFLGERAALALVFIFVAIPLGALFGSTFFQYAKWAARGFADPAAATFFLAGLVALVGRDATGPSSRFAPALGAGFLFALAIWVRPNLAPGAAILLGGAGLAAFWQTQFARLAGLCLGFLPVFGMAAHNWVFGHALVLFSSNATIAEALPMPPPTYAAALGEFARFQLTGPNVAKWALQWARWLAGPSESFAMIPLHVVAVAIVLRMPFLRRADPWARLIAGATLALYPVAWFYLSAGRYYYLMWFLTFLVCAVWVRDEGFALLRSYTPRLATWIETSPLSLRMRLLLRRYA